MSFLDHLEELRWHIFRAVIALIVITIILFAWKGLVFDSFLFGPIQDDFITYKSICSLTTNWLGKGLFCKSVFPFKMQNIDITAQFILHLKASISTAVVVVFPYIIYELWSFISPGLHQKEARATRSVVLLSSILFYIGVAFGYYLLFPMSLNFFTGYSISDMVVNQFDVKSYINFMIMLLIASGVMFELPIVVVILSKLGLLTPGLMRTYRRHALVVIFVLAAFITPADPGTMFLVALPLAVLYEFSILLSRRIFRNQQKRNM